MLWAERAASKSDDEGGTGVVQVHVLIQPGEPEEAAGWRSQGVSGGGGEKALGDEGAAVLSTQYGPSQPRGAQGRAVELDGRSALPSEEEGRQAQLPKG